MARKPQLRQDDAPEGLKHNPFAALRPDGKLAGPFVRREGKERRFVYIAIAGQAGQTDAAGQRISRRAKIDIHDIPADLLRPGATLEAQLPGRSKDGTPACATVRPLGPWSRID